MSTPGGSKRLNRKLYDAVKVGKPANVIDNLLAQGADPNSPVGKKGRNAMQRAAEKKHLEVERLLAAKGGKLHATSILNPSSSMDEGDGVEQGPDDHHEPQPAPERMSRLASGAGTSVRLKKKKSDNHAVEWELANPGATPVEREWEFDRSRLKQDKQLGSGQFGVVFQGVAQGLVAGQAETCVAVKMLSDTSPIMEDDFFKEVAIMKALDGPHKIVRLLGICTEERPFLMIMELMENGDLKSVLRDSRPTPATVSPLTLRDLARMGADVAEGMGYLASNKIVHRDLAARNCLVNSNMEVKVSSCL